MDWKKGIKWVVAFLCAIVFLSLMSAVSDHDVLAFDSAAINFMHELRSPVLTFFLRGITELGGAIVIGLATVALFFAIKNKRLSFAILGNILGVLIVNQVFKFLIQRPRPDVAHRLIEQSGYSFPSGHSMMATVFYGFLTYLLYRSKLNKSVKIIILIMVLFLILLIGISRIYLGVHYTSDVIGGFLWGSTLLILIIVLTKKGKLL